MILLTDSGLTLPGLPVSASCSYVHRNKLGYKDTCGVKKKKKRHIHIWYLLDKNRCRHINTVRFKHGDSSESSHERMAALHLDLCTTETPSSASQAQSAAAGSDKRCLLSTRESQRHLVLTVEVLTGLDQDGDCSGSAPLWIPEASRTELKLLLHTGHVQAACQHPEPELGGNDSAFCLGSYCGQSTLLVRMSTLDHGFGPQCPFQPDVPWELGNVTYSMIPQMLSVTVCCLISNSMSIIFLFTFERVAVKKFWAGYA